MAAEGVQPPTAGKGGQPLRQRTLALPRDSLYYTSFALFFQAVAGSYRHFMARVGAVTSMRVFLFSELLNGSAQPTARDFLAVV
ncbi:MAG: hypothetical protein FWE19_06720 [Oscillospiraceae bacterium]|nr:hypothetical protein [Oscillospiraceae bacterium]